MHKPAPLAGGPAPQPGERLKGYLLLDSSQDPWRVGETVVLSFLRRKYAALLPPFLGGPGKELAHPGSGDVEGPTPVVRAAVEWLVLLESLEAGASYLSILLLGLLTSAFGSDMTVSNLWLFLAISLLEGGVKLTGNFAAKRTSKEQSGLLYEHWGEPGGDGSVRQAATLALHLPPGGRGHAAPGRPFVLKAHISRWSCQFACDQRRPTGDALAAKGSLAARSASPPAAPPGTIWALLHTKGFWVRFLHVALYAALWVCGLQGHHSDVRKYDLQHSKTDYRWLLRQYETMLATGLVLAARYSLHGLVLFMTAWLRHLPALEHSARFEAWLKQNAAAELQGQDDFEKEAKAKLGDLKQEIDTFAKKSDELALAKLKKEASLTLQDYEHKTFAWGLAKMKMSAAEGGELKDFVLSASGIEGTVNESIDGATMGKVAAAIGSFFEAPRGGSLEDAMAPLTKMIAEKASLVKVKVSEKMSAISEHDEKPFEHNNVGQQEAFTEWAKQQRLLLLESLKEAGRHAGTRFAIADAEIIKIVEHELNIGMGTIEEHLAARAAAFAASPLAGSLVAPTVADVKKLVQEELRKAGRAALQTMLKKAGAVAQKNAAVWLAHLRQHGALGGTGAEAAAVSTPPTTWFLNPTQLHELLSTRIPAPGSPHWDPASISAKPAAMVLALKALASFAARGVYPTVPGHPHSASTPHYWSRSYWDLGQQLLWNADPSTHPAILGLMAVALPYLPDPVRVLRLRGCGNVRQLAGLEALGELAELDLALCENLEGTLDLRKQTKLRRLDLSGCRSLQQLQGLEDNEWLEAIDLTGCKQLTALPRLGTLGRLESDQFKYDGCRPEVQAAAREWVEQRQGATGGGDPPPQNT